MIAIFYALKDEIKSFKKKIEQTEHKQFGNTNFYKCNIFDKDLLLVQTGIGIKNSELAVKTLIDNYETDLIISTGIAGGLQNVLKVGDMVCSNNVLFTQNIEYTTENIYKTCQKISCDKKYFDYIKDVCNENDLNLHFGDTLTVENVVKSSEEKVMLGKHAKSLAVEMETFKIAEVALQKSIDFISIRSISDEVDFDLNVDKISEIKDDGTIDITKTSFKIIKNLNQVPNIMQLRKQVILASSNIADFLQNFLFKLDNFTN